MYRFSPDDEALLFLDCFGATRIEFPKKLKTVRTIPGGWNSSVTMSAAGDRALVDDGGWGRVYAFELPSLKPLHKYQRFERNGALLLGDGERLLLKDRRRLVTLDGREAGRLKTEAELGEPLELWATRDLGYYRVATFSDTMAPNGAFAWAKSPRWALELTYGSETEVRWRRPLEVHGGHRHLLFPRPEGLVITSLSPLERKVFVAWLDATGELVEAFESSGIGVPERTDGAIAWQVDEDTVCRRRDTGEEQRFSIAEATEIAHRQKKHPRALPKGDFLGGLGNAGSGAVLLGQRRLLFLPWHHETIVDLIEGREIHRKLPEAEHAPRVAFRRRVGWAQRFAREADILVHGAACEIKAKQGSYWTSVEQTRGEGGLAALLVGGAAAGLFTEDPAAHRVGDWRWSGGGGGGHEYMSGTFGEEDLLRAFEIFDDHGVFLFWSLWRCREVYQRRLEGESGSRHHGERLGPVLTKGAEKLFIQAFLASAEDAPRYTDVDEPQKTPSFKLMDRVEAWREASLDEESFRARAAAVCHSNIDEGFYELLRRSYFEDGPYRQE